MRSRRSPLTHPRGRLPSRVYWLRRGAVVVTALLLVLGFAKLLGGFGGGSGPAVASLSANETTSSSSGTPSATSVTPPEIPAASLPTSSSPSPALAAPSGPCDLADLSVTPVVSVAHAVNPVTIALKLTGSASACNFKASAKTLAVKIVSGKDDIWSSQDCPRSIASRTVVVRSGAETTVPVTWSGRRSNGTCSDVNEWAMPGYYHVFAAVMGSTPTDTQFQLTVAPRAVITRTAKPKPHDKTTPAPTHSTTPTTPARTDSATKPSGPRGTGSACGGDNAASSC